MDVVRTGSDPEKIFHHHNQWHHLIHQVLHIFQWISYQINFTIKISILNLLYLVSIYANAKTIKSLKFPATVSHPIKNYTLSSIIGNTKLDKIIKIKSFMDIRNPNSLVGNLNQSKDCQFMIVKLHLNLTFWRFRLEQNSA